MGSLASRANKIPLCDFDLGPDIQNWSGYDQDVLAFQQMKSDLHQKLQSEQTEIQTQVRCDMKMSNSMVTLKALPSWLHHF